MLEDKMLVQQEFDPSAFVAAVTIVRHTIGDKIISVCQRSINFLTSLCTQLDPDLTDSQRKELSTQTEFIMSSLVEKLGDNLAKVRQASEEAILVMCNHPAFGPRLCINWIIKKSKASGTNTPSSNNTKKALNSNKLIIGKYLILSRILSEVQGLQ